MAASTKKTLFMETTTIAAEQTAAEISAVLIRAGATQIATEYDNGKVKGLRWIMKMPDGREMFFQMPARVDPVFKILQDRRKYPYDRRQKEADDRAQAQRVAWRQLLRWTQAQLAMIETGMVKAQEVFFAYIQSPTGQTLFEYWSESQFKALGPAADDNGGRPQ